jgi:hypothetical protein
VDELMRESYDVVVVGGAAGGLNAALVLARSRRRVAVVDAGEPRNAPAAHMYGFLSRDGMPPADLLSAGRAELTGYGVEVIEGRGAHSHCVSVGPRRAPRLHNDPGRRSQAAPTSHCASWVTAEHRGSVTPGFAHGLGARGRWLASADVGVLVAPPARCRDFDTANCFARRICFDYLHHRDPVRACTRFSMLDAHARGHLAGVRTQYRARL